jgi:hypothetical protein
MKQLVDDPKVALVYPEEEDVKVTIEAATETKRQKSQSMLNTLNRNAPVLGERAFDPSIPSPSKVLKGWIAKFTEQIEH